MAPDLGRSADGAAPLIRHRDRAVSLAGVLVAAAVCAGCGSDAEPAAKPVADRAATFEAQSFLMRDGEQPGLRRVERPRTESFRAFATSATPAEARDLRRAGFISITSQPIEGPDTYGVTNVQLFRTTKGARDTLAYEMRTDVIRGRGLPDAKISRFTVPGIPGARGWSAPKDGRRVGNVHWVQGRCLLVLGNEGPGRLAKALSTGAQAIHHRTDGACPS